MQANSHGCDVGVFCFLRVERYFESGRRRKLSEVFRDAPNSCSPDGRGIDQEGSWWPVLDRGTIQHYLAQQRASSRRSDGDGKVIEEIVVRNARIGAQTAVLRNVDLREGPDALVDGKGGRIRDYEQANPAGNSH